MLGQECYTSLLQEVAGLVVHGVPHCNHPPAKMAPMCSGSPSARPRAAAGLPYTSVTASPYSEARRRARSREALPRSAHSLVSVCAEGKRHSSKRFWNGWVSERSTPFSRGLLSVLSQPTSSSQPPGSPDVPHWGL